MVKRCDWSRDTWPRDLLIAVVLGLLLGGVLSMIGCGPVSRPDPTPPPPPKDFTPDCRDIFAQDYRRAPTDVEIAACLEEFHKVGATDPKVRAALYARFPRPTAPTVVRGRLSASGESFIYPDGKIFEWRGATGFALVSLVATGHEAEARAFLTWAHETGFSIVRVLTMCAASPTGGMFQLAPADGRAALPRLLELAREQDLYVEVVALAATRRFGFDEAKGRAHLREVARVAAAHENAVVQIANEYPDGSQADFVQDVDRVSKLASEIPAEVLYTVSSPGGDKDEAPQPQGEYLTRHRARRSEPWDNVRRLVEIMRVGHAAKKPIVDDEPTGAAEAPRGGSRMTNPGFFYAQGLLARGFGIGSTFHFEDGLYARVPGPVQQTAAKAFIAGTRFVPDGARFRFENAKHSTSPVKDANFGQYGRIFSFLGGGRDYAVAVGIAGGVQWQNGYRPSETREPYPGVIVYRLAR